MQNGQAQPQQEQGFFRPENPETVAGPAPQPSGKAITWTASEFIAHHKTPAWFLKLAGITAVAAAIVYLLTRDYITAGMIVIVAAAFGAIAARPPRVLNYKVDNRGFTIGPKFYGYFDFKSFSVIDEGPINSIFFLPLKRFMPGISIYYAPEDEQRIITLLAEHLPQEFRQHDAIDRLMHTIRF
jgi:hypothetical protein